MRWLGLLVVSMSLSASVPSFALPYAEADAAYARGDYAAAFKFWLPLAEQGSARAQQMVGRMYERGEWVAQDSQAAAEWYAKASDQRARDAAMPTIGSTAAPADPNANVNVASAAVAAPPAAPPPPVTTTYTPPARQASAPVYHYSPPRPVHAPAPARHSHSHGRRH